MDLKTLPSYVSRMNITFLRYSVPQLDKFVISNTEKMRIFVLNTRLDYKGV